MCRFDESHSLAARLERGELTSEQVVAVARCIARFHARARRVSGDRAVLVLERRFEANVHELFGSLEQRGEIDRVVALDRALRELDVGDDLAFLVLDLAACGAERFGRQLVEAYRSAGGEPGEDALIAFYAAYRALVRSKVALTRAAQHPLASGEHGHHSGHAPLARRGVPPADRGRER